MTDLVDVRELTKLAEDIGAAWAKVAPEVTAATLAVGRKIQADARASAPRGHARLYPNSITTTTKRTARGIEVEVGPNKDLPQGALGNLLEFGSSNNGPHPHLVPAWENAQPAWINDVVRALDRGI